MGAISTLPHDAGRRTRSSLNSVVGRWIMMPIAIVVAGVVAVIGLYTPKAVVDFAIEEAIEQSVQTADHLKTLRSFYSANVVAKLAKGGNTASPSYKGSDAAIPVPTTFLLDLAASYSTDQIKVSLVSPYPWPTRAGRELDDFQKFAWSELTRSPGSRVARRETVGGREVLRVAIGDRMDASCVGCHNQSPQSPRHDWKVGDVRGLIEIVQPIDQITAVAGRLSAMLVAAILVAGIVLFAALYVIGRRLVRPMRDLTGFIDRMSEGHLAEEVPHADRCDELGTVARALAKLQDQTGERLRAEAQILHMARHDALTGLPNRALFAEELDRALRERAPDRSVAVLCLDLDRFKAVNDTLGHPIGDALLRQVASRLAALMADHHVCRLGGDEFAVILAADETEARDAATRIIAELSAPYDVEGHQIIVGASAGAAFAPRDGTCSKELTKNADLALYRAKGEGRGIFRPFEPSMDRQLMARRELELDLRRALAAGQFELHYQPLIHIERAQICGFEALLRWCHPERGMIPPADFIPLAEEIGEIEAIGAWVIQAACQEAAGWPDDLKVAVNLSPVQFRSGSLVLHVTAALARAGLRPDRLELEITESLMLQDTEATLTTLHDLRNLGVRISMDDFGTGYSSLSYLRRFPFDKIKIDRSFIRDLSETEGSVAIVRAVMGLSSGLGMSTTAEGVETEEQLLRLRREGCVEAQGYLISPPRPASAVAEMLAEYRAETRRAAG